MRMSDQSQTILENLDNYMRKTNNIRIRRLKGILEGSILCSYLEDLFTNSLGSEKTNEVIIENAFWIGRLKKQEIHII